MPGVFTAAALAQSSSASFEIPRSSIDAGATEASSARFALRATLAQPDAAPAMSSPRFSLQGGLHRPAGGDSPDALIFSGGFEAATP